MKTYKQIIDALELLVTTSDPEIQKCMNEYLRLTKCPVPMRLMIRRFFRKYVNIMDYNNLTKQHSLNWSYGHYKSRKWYEGHDKFIIDLKRRFDKRYHPGIDRFQQECSRILNLPI